MPSILHVFVCPYLLEVKKKLYRNSSNPPNNIDYSAAITFFVIFYVVVSNQ